METNTPDTNLKPAAQEEHAHHAGKPQKKGLSTGLTLAFVARSRRCRSATRQIRHLDTKEAAQQLLHLGLRRAGRSTAAGAAHLFHGTDIHHRRTDALHQRCEIGQTGHQRRRRQRRGGCHRRRGHHGRSRLAGRLPRLLCRSLVVAAQQRQRHASGQCMARHAVPGGAGRCAGHGLAGGMPIV